MVNGEDIQMKKGNFYVLKRVNGELTFEEVSGFIETVDGGQFGIWQVVRGLWQVVEITTGLKIFDKTKKKDCFEALNGDMIRFVKKELKREQHNEYANMLQRFKEEKNEK